MVLLGTGTNVPAAVHGWRHGDDDEEFADYPVSSPYCPVLSLRVLDQVRERFAPHGYFIPLAVVGRTSSSTRCTFPGTQWTASATPPPRRRAALPHATGRCLLPLGG
jgi:hypothetical protein